jgi:signal transduction histidine kinase
LQGSAAIPGVDRSTLRRETTSPGRRSVAIGGQAWLAIGLFVAAGVWTLLILFTPSFRFTMRWPRARVPIEMTGALTAVLVATLAYFRFAFTGVRALLLVAVAFLVLGINQFAFGVLVPPEAIGRDLDVYIWVWGRLIAGGLLLAGTLPRFRRPAVRKHPFFELLLGTAAATWLVVLGPVGLFVLGRHLPPLWGDGDVPASAINGAHPALSGIDVGLGLLGATVFLLAAARYSARSRTGTSAPALLGPALVLAAFSHVHYALMPTVFSGRISTGDLLRIAFHLLVVVGLMWEIRSAYIAERGRSMQLESAFAAERERVKELERLDRAHAEFLRLVTHELMHPIAAARSWIVTLRRRWDSLDDQGKREIVARLDAETARLRDLAEQAPDAGDAGTLLQPVLLGAHRVTDLVNQAGAAAEELNGRLRIYVDRVARTASVRADGTRILQTLRNLLLNAARHSGEGDVELSVFGDPQTVLFEVRDFGTGIAPKDLPHIFEQGYRGSGTRVDEGGTGLGLYICKRIVEAHGGAIWATSWPTQGTCVSFTLPVTRKTS